MSNLWETDPQRRWERDTRQWWGWLLLAGAWIVLSWILRGLGLYLFPVLAVLIAFHARYFYNDRLRQLGKMRGFLPKLRRPPSDETIRGADESEPPPTGAHGG